MRTALAFPLAVIYISNRVSYESSSNIIIHKIIQVKAVTVR